MERDEKREKETNETGQQTVQEEWREAFFESAGKRRCGS
jgi:hypothetical protein